MRKIFFTFLILLISMSFVAAQEENGVKTWIIEIFNSVIIPIIIFGAAGMVISFIIKMFKKWWAAGKNPNPGQQMPPEQQLPPQQQQVQQNYQPLANTQQNQQQQ
ncbi:hypothetical protein ACFLZZ_03555 [Nanoarchaeota archaeon]